MKNKEKYYDEILNIFLHEEDLMPLVCEFKRKFISESITNCANVFCIDCNKIFKKWLEEEYVEPAVDWSQVPVDTKILVSNVNSQTANWEKKYFSHCNEQGKIFAFNNGLTSWTAEGYYSYWPYAKLAEEE